VASLIVRTLLCAAALLPVSGMFAQHTLGYGFAGVTTLPGRQVYTFWHGNYFHPGIGGEAGIGRWLTLGGEVGGLISTESLQRNAAVLSAGPAFHLLPRGTTRIDPFVTGGLSVLVSRGAGGMLHYGGGVNYWFRPRLAFRFEVRDHLWAPEGDYVHFTSIRAGISFR
jgi:hypothetical protein